MLTSELLLNILTPDIIEQIGKDNILTIKKVGAENHYLITNKARNSYIYNQTLDYSNKKIQELAQTPLASNFTYEGNILFHSTIKFPNDDDIINILKQLSITKEEIEQMNYLITQCQQNHIQYVIQSKKLEDDYDLKVEQVERIIKIPKKLIINTLLKINTKGNMKETLKASKEMLDYEMELFDKAMEFHNKLKCFEIDENDALNNLNLNATFQRLVAFSKIHYGLELDSLFMFINKINELLVTCPERFNHTEKQQKVKN